MVLRGSGCKRSTDSQQQQQRPINAQELTEEGAESFHDLFGDTPVLFQGAEQGEAVEDIPDGALGTSLGDSEMPLDDDADFPDLPEEGMAQMIGDGFTDDDVAAWHDRSFLTSPFRVLDGPKFKTDCRVLLVFSDGP